MIEKIVQTAKQTVKATVESVSAQPLPAISASGAAVVETIALLRHAPATSPAER
jgi:hypothetical protein